MSAEHLHHIIHGKPTTHGHTVHYTDHTGMTHAAVITNVTGEAHTADLHVLHRVTGEPVTIKAVPHSVESAPHSWKHLPY